jgi:two-component system, sporulation sensor kinase B
MLGINNLLVNILIILLSIFVTFALGLYKDRRVILWMGLPSAIVILCMSFPFSMLPGYIYDLRIIPLLLGYLYLGSRVGLFTFATLLFYRYSIGGIGFFTTIHTFTFLMFITYFFVRSFHSYSSRKRIAISTALAFLSSLVETIESVLQMQFKGIHLQGELKFFASYCLIHLLAMWMSSYIIEMMRENASMREEIQRAEKMQVVGELAASIAHEIRNPMTVIQGFIQLLQKEHTEEQRRFYTGLMMAEVNRSESIIEDYLSYAKPQIDRKEPVNIKEQTIKVVNMISSYAKSHNVEIRYLELYPLYVLANAEKINQVLINIVKNGIEAMQIGGILEIRTYQDKKNVVIDIIDSGAGLTDEEIKRLGEPFYSTKEKGTGLGLMVSYRLVDAMKGKLKVVSKKGKGTTFTISLPIYKPV